ncbi:hypothetical protein C5167_033417, partial [Papaver somniferum]
FKLASTTTHNPGHCVAQTLQLCLFTPRHPPTTVQTSTNPTQTHQLRFRCQHLFSANPNSKDSSASELETLEFDKPILNFFINLFWFFSISLFLLHSQLQFTFSRFKTLSQTTTDQFKPQVPPESSLIAIFSNSSTDFSICSRNSSTLTLRRLYL